MQSIKKSIEFFAGEKYRELPYGTIYYVAGTASSALNEYVQAHAESIAEQLNQDGSNWITYRIVYLDALNPLFAPHRDATLYSAMLPTNDYHESDFGFFVARLEITAPELAEEAFSIFFCTLQQMLDEVLDEGHYQEYHFSTTILSATDDSGIRFSVAHREGHEVLFSATSVEPQPLPFTEPSRLEITSGNYQVLLPDYGIAFRFGAQVKALYILFLNHPEGIRIKDIADYKEEFKKIYFYVTTWSDTDRLRDSVNRLFDVCNRNKLDVKKSQCNAEIREVIPNEELNRHYIIEVARGERHKINLDRSLVSMPETLRF